MSTKLTQPISNLFKDLIQFSSSILDLTHEEVITLYSMYPICSGKFIENVISRKYLDIRLSKEEITLTCSFNQDNKCEFAFFYGDENITLKFVDYLLDYYEYDFVESRWLLSDCFLKITESKRDNNKFCFNFFR